ncbi:MAG: hypothetical protein Q7S22_08865 [Candidatus Micrarchaeota archaeon]|nr:hypothetical protein [Candidatus Micrarchaeota archaeon]
MHISKVKVLPNYNKPWAKSLALRVKKFLRKHKFQIVRQNEDIAVCIGGDGTILYANHKRKFQHTVFGIGTKTSYMCALRKDNWRKWLVHLLRNGKYENRLLVNAAIKDKDYEAMNDVVVHSNDFRVITIFLEVDGKSYQFEGDGIIISTPMGSSAYAYSAGGKMLNPASRQIEIVPICPYKRTIKPFLVSPDSKITVSCDRTWTLIIDGIKIRKVGHKEKLNVTVGRTIRFLIS